ncbi:MAG TPA: hypothetical protein VHN80_12310 [Kineosporiaceae bacterium]|nr:hypothetical protein [Kineosporiaceae bacterium]
MNVTVGTLEPSVRGVSAPMVHLVVEVANRQVLACTGGVGTRLRTVPLDAVFEELTCGPCRAFWKRTVGTPSA